MAKKPKPEGKKYNYMDTYGDLVTLLLCFFVLLFAMSTVEESKYNAFVEALSNQFGPTPANLSTITNPDAPPGDDFGDEEPTEGETLDPVENMPAELRQLYEDITEYVEQNNMEGEVSVEVGESGAIFIRLSHNLLFDGNSSVLRTEAMDFLDFMGGGFVQVEDKILQVNILGHTGSDAGSSVDDWMLSGERASRVASYLYRTVEFSPYKMHSQGYGRFYPIADNEDPNTKGANRRVDMIVVGNEVDDVMMALAEAQRVYFPEDDTQFFEGAPDELPSHTLDDAMARASNEVDLNPENLTDEQIRQLYEIAQNQD